MHRRKLHRRMYIMKYCLCCFLLLISVSFSFAQKDGFTWVFSDPFIIRFDDTSITAVDTFLPGPRLPFFNTSFTASDSAGSLQFYTNGAYIYNRLGEIMDGCDTFVSPSEYVKSITNNGAGVGAGSAQGVVGFRKPGSENLYYLFHNISSDCTYPDQWPCYLYYSLIDMAQNNGLGRVIDLNHIVYTDSELYLSHLAINACKHANGTDWWLIQGKTLRPAENLIFLVDKDGIHEPYIQSIGGDTSWYPNYGGRLIFSPDGTMMAKALGVGRTHLYNFNRCNGGLSNLRFISTIDSVASPDSIPISGNIAFSPNSRFLYVNTLVKVFQYDLWASDIQGSETKVWDIGTLNSDYTLFVMQLAPDGRIYIGPHSSGADRKNLTVINKPNEKGDSCDFRYGGVPFPNMKWHGLGVPNMPNFRLPPSPVYIANAGNDVDICVDTTMQLGSVQRVPGLTYTWASNDPLAYISDLHTHAPIVSTKQAEVEFYLNVLDTASRYTCVERTDTVKIMTHKCYPTTFVVPTFISCNSNPFFTINSSQDKVSLRVFSLTGQLVYCNDNYQNNWDTRLSSQSVYLVEVSIDGQTRYRGKVVIMN